MDAPSSSASNLAARQSSFSIVVHIEDFKGRKLSVCGSNLVFGENVDCFSIQSGGKDSACFLKHDQTWQWLSRVEGGGLTLGDNPTSFDIFTDLNKGSAFKLDNGSFLASDRRNGALIALDGPLRSDKTIKLFRIIQVTPPPLHLMEPWPIRCHLMTPEGLYISNSGGKLTASSEVPCCSEELILDYGGIKNRSKIWSANASNVASFDPGTGQLIMTSQHSCTGDEDFLLNISLGNELTISSAQSGTDSINLVCAWPFVHCIPKNKPTKLKFELTTKPVFIMTAHGGLLRSTFGGTVSIIMVPLGDDDVNAASWVFEHRGDSLYTIRNVATKRLLYIGSTGSLKIDGNDPPFPNSKLLFHLEFADANSAVDNRRLLPGFSITTVSRVDRCQLRLTTLPSNRIATCYHTINQREVVEQTDVFTLADRDAVLGSTSNPLNRLPRRSTSSEKEELDVSPSVMKRSTSCHAILRNSSEHSMQLLSKSPSTVLFHIDENCVDDSIFGSCNRRDVSPDPELPLHFSGQTTSEKGKGRRCASAPCLNRLGCHVWLADLKKKPQRPNGWNTVSAAPLTEHACHVVCSEKFPIDHVDLPDEIRDVVSARMDLLMAQPSAVKLCLRHLAKAAAQGTAPDWSTTLPRDAFEEDEMPEELAESYVCISCKGTSGFILPMDPEINPRHYKFLDAMSRRQFGGQRRRGGRGGDAALLVGLKVAKNGLIFWGIFRFLYAVMK